MNVETVLSALLDFYSDKASAHASFLVALAIGLFTIPALGNGADIHLLSFLFVGLWFFGLWTLLNFSYFSEHAALTRYALTNPKGAYKDYQISKDSDESLEVQISRNVHEKWNRSLIRLIFILVKTRKRLKPKLGNRDSRLKLSLFFPHFYFALGLIVIRIFFPETIVERTFWFGVSIVILDACTQFSF
jgi:hypothetical protein